MDKVISQKKVEMFTKAQKLFSENEKFMIMDLNKVKGTQFKNIKNFLPEEVKFLYCKKKILIKALRDLDQNKYKALIENIKNNIIVCFFDGCDPKEILKVCERFLRTAHARFGDIANEDVIVPAGPTGLDPLKINFFQAAHMNTKIVKDKIEIAAAHKLVSKGEIVGISEANLLTMLNIKPFSYSLNIKKVFEGAEIYESEILKIEDKDIEEEIKNNIQKIATLSLGLDILTEASAPYEIRGAYSEVKKISLGLDFSIGE